jgi:hypothetical protein
VHGAAKGTVYLLRQLATYQPSCGTRGRACQGLARPLQRAGTAGNGQLLCWRGPPPPSTAGCWQVPAAARLSPPPWSSGSLLSTDGYRRFQALPAAHDTTVAGCSDCSEAWTTRVRARCRGCDGTEALAVPTRLGPVPFVNF